MPGEGNGLGRNGLERRVLRAHAGFTACP
jgi:hypothetical protein